MSVSEAVIAATAEWAEAGRAYEVARKKLVAARNAAVIAVRPDIVEFDLSHGLWSCRDSPTGKCAYHKGYFDECIFCGHPEERK